MNFWRLRAKYTGVRQGRPDGYFFHLLRILYIHVAQYFLVIFRLYHFLMLLIFRSSQRRSFIMFSHIFLNLSTSLLSDVTSVMYFGNDSVDNFFLFLNPISERFFPGRIVFQLIFLYFPNWIES